MYGLKMTIHRLAAPLAIGMLALTGATAMASDTPHYSSALVSGASVTRPVVGPRLSRLIVKHVMSRPHALVPASAVTEVNVRSADGKHCEQLLPPALTAVPFADKDARSPG